jgi:VIT1/CCC1 family predicted Fe2+/Mn2+ transporter
MATVCLCFGLSLPIARRLAPLPFMRGAFRERLVAQPGDAELAAKVERRYSNRACLVVGGAIILAPALGTLLVYVLGDALLVAFKWLVVVSLVVAVLAVAVVAYQLLRLVTRVVRAQISRGA